MWWNQLQSCLSPFPYRVHLTSGGGEEISQWKWPNLQGYFREGSDWQPVSSTFLKNTGPLPSVWVPDTINVFTLCGWKPQEDFFIQSLDSKGLTDRQLINQENTDHCIHYSHKWSLSKILLLIPEFYTLPMATKALVWPLQVYNTGTITIYISHTAD